ncbi:MAG: glutamate--cysteine ligase [Alphaproteobacteria bacterium]
MPEADAVITDARQLVEYFAAGSKAKADWLIGTEHEKFAFRISTLRPVAYDEPKGLRDLFQVLKIFGWREIMEAGHVIALQRGGAQISLEPGGQTELAGAPVRNLHETAAEIDQHLEELREVSTLLDIGFMGIGFHPAWKREDVPWMPKQRYDIMRAYMPKRGKLGHDMMQRTCTTQVNLDYADEADMVKKMRVAMALQPIATALFAASPFLEGRPAGYQSYRMQVWQDTDPDRSGFLPFVFDDGFGFERYRDYALDVPMYFVRRDDKYIDASGQSFRDFMKGKLPALPGEMPTITDWQDHLSTLFPDVRLKQYLEMRGADCGTAESILALPSFWTGILYDETACDTAWQLVQEWTIEERLTLQRDVPKQGLKLEFRGQPLSAIAHQAVKLAQQGLRRRAMRLHGGADETRYLDGLFMMTESATSYADELLMRFEHQWSGDIKGAFTDCRL